MNCAKERNAAEKAYSAEFVLFMLFVFLPFLCSPAHALSWSPPRLIVDNNEVHGASVSVDSNGNWHVVYETYSSPPFVGYARSVGGPSIITQSPDLNMSCPSIAIDSNDKVYIVYVTNSGVMYTNNRSGFWSKPQLIVDNDEVHGASISVDSNGNWHVVYQTYSNPPFVGYVRSVGGPSIITQSPDLNMSCPSIAIDSNDKVYIAYVTNSGVMYTNNRSGFWSRPQLIVDNNEVHGASISVDSDGNWHAVYHTYSIPPSVGYVRSVGGPSIVTQSPDLNMSCPSIALDSNDKVQITYVTSSGVMHAVSGHTTHVLSVGLNWGPSLRGDLDADNLAGIFEMALLSVNELNILHLDPSISDGSNLAAFNTGFASLLNKVDSGDTIILSFASHGESEVNGVEPPFVTNLAPHPLGYGHGPNEPRTGDEYVLLADEDYANDDSDRLYDDALRTLLADEQLTLVRKILVFDNCRSGGFGPDLTSGIGNIAVLAGCNEGYFTFSDNDGTGVFSNTIRDGLSEGPDGFPQADGADGSRKDGTVSLVELDQFVQAFDFGDLVGEDLPLRYLTGTGVFNGLDVDFSASDDFVGGFEGPFPGDIDNDRRVDASDFIILAAQWLEPPGAPSADIAPDGGDDFVDFRDLGKLVEHWLEGTTP